MTLRVFRNGKQSCAVTFLTYIPTTTFLNLYAWEEVSPGVEHIEE